MDNTSEIYATFWNHLHVLRRSLFGVLAIISLGVMVSLFWYDQIFSLLTYPLKNLDQSMNTQPANLHMYDLQHKRIHNDGNKDLVYTLPDHSTITVLINPLIQKIGERTFIIPPNGFLDIDILREDNKLLIFSPLEGMSTMLKICFWIGLVGTSPIWLVLILRFILPAINRKYYSLLWTFFFSSLTLISLGFLFAYYFVIPLTNQYFYAFNSFIGLNNWALNLYVDYTLILLLANGFAFELGAVLVFLVHLGIISVETLVAMRRQAIVVAFILGALLTTPDVITQVMLAVPLIILYELTIIYGKIRTRKLNSRLGVIKNWGQT